MGRGAVGRRAVGRGAVGRGTVGRGGTMARAKVKYVVHSTVEKTTCFYLKYNHIKCVHCKYVNECKVKAYVVLVFWLVYC